MKVYASGLPKNTEFDFFVLQQPDAPFGLSWYQGDLQSDKNPATPPVHQYHLGFWFNSPKDAAKAGCPAGSSPEPNHHRRARLVSVRYGHGRS